MKPIYSISLIISFILFSFAMNGCKSHQEVSDPQTTTEKIDSWGYEDLLGEWIYYSSDEPNPDTLRLEVKYLHFMRGTEGIMRRDITYSDTTFVYYYDAETKQATFGGWACTYTVTGVVGNVMYVTIDYWNWEHDATTTYHYVFHRINQ